MGSSCIHCGLNLGLITLKESPGYFNVHALEQYWEVYILLPIISLKLSKKTSSGK